MRPLRAIILILLVTAVIKFGKPLRAAAVFGVIAAASALLTGAEWPDAALTGALDFLIAAVVFWLIDWSENILLWLVITVIGVGVLFLAP